VPISIQGAGFCWQRLRGGKPLAGTLLSLLLNVFAGWQ